MTASFVTVFTLTLISILCLYYAWNKKIKPLVKVGWGINLLSLYLWCLISGWEFGSIYWMIFSALFAWLFIIFNSQIKSEVNISQQREFKCLSFLRVSHATGTFLVSVPLAMIASCSFSLFIIQWSSAEQANQLVFAAFLFPTLWALAGYWVCAAEKILQPFIGLLIISTVCSAGIFFRQFL